MKRMEQIAPPPTAKKTVLNVAAYARISMETERTPISLSTQISYYQKLITSTPGWNFAGVFADSGISGTTTKRPQFQELLTLARAGKIDIILTKSISRFSRNTVDLLQIVRELKDLGVEVRFEKEGISSMTGDGELMLTLLASFAQAESEQLSANVKWRVEKQFEKGLANGFRHYGYTNSPCGTDVEIIEHEAALVRRIYRLYLEQVSCERMEEIFAAEGILGRSGEPITSEVLRSWLKAETFTGTLILGRHHSPHFGEHSVLNKGEKPMYRVEDAIPAIISKELFEAVQQERARRRELGARANWSIPTTCFTSTVKCGICGRSFSRSGKYNTAHEIHYVWSCRTKRDGYKRSGGRRCTAKNIPQAILEEHLAPHLGLEVFDPEVYESLVETVVMLPDQKIRINFKDGRQVELAWKSNRRERSWSPERRAAWGEFQRQKWQDPEYRERTIASRKKKAKPRKPLSDGARKSMRDAWTPERRQAQAERSKAMWAARTEEERAEHIRKCQEGITEEAKQRKSEKLKAAWTPERRARTAEIARQTRAREKRKREEAMKAGEI